MSYFAPYIDETGMHIPTYNDILEDLIASMKSIFGNDIYIDEDTQDYQQMSIFSKKIYDAYSLAMLVYNNRTAITSVGYGLDNMCAMAGIVRNPATYSTVQLTLTGSEGTVISNGKASDGTSVFKLPDTVTIPANGVITVEAVCDTAGNVNAAANTITEIVTPTFGWIGVTNNYAAAPGKEVETDAELRARYALSTVLPSSTVFDGTKAAILTVDGVKRVAAYENDTSEVNSLGHPPHSVTFVVDGGDDIAIATQIYFKKTPGCYTNGTTLVPVTSVAGNVTNIRFYRPTYKSIKVKLAIKKLSGYSTSYESAIKDAVQKYINELDISETIFRQSVLAVAISQLGSISAPAFTISNVYLAADDEEYEQQDITMNFNEVGECSADDVVLEVS